MMWPMEWLMNKHDEAERKGHFNVDAFFIILLMIFVGLIEIATYPIWRPVLWLWKTTKGTE